MFLTEDGRQNVRMNRHGYFEVLYLCSGAADCHIQDRLLPFKEGDLAIVGSTLYHRIECQSSPLTIAALFFEPDLIRSDGGSDSAEYLTPFLLQDSEFPHVVPAETGIPNQVLDLMLRIRSELPSQTTRGRLAIKTYLKMILILLLNRYVSYTGTVETFQRQQRDLDRLLPLFKFLGENCGSQIHVKEASRISGMCESHFMSFFKRVTGLSFMKYLNHYRVERAQAMLVNTDESMAVISQEMGFCDQSYFGTVFRKLVGMTPAAYRRRFRNGGGGSDHARVGHAPFPVTTKVSLSGASRGSTHAINRQSAALPIQQIFERPQAS
ncbi:helix-turn-helix transcriptional regulator [Acidisarcina polymorpha]|uniref:helix-turn-helix transcriptional regulator n=1 Tax=Acidisarcina polymorpha TaxID=2211140 RepID=UPI001374C74E|nr:AraC family transcriptional regulator [Acidisarcina polymorpha]